MCNWKKVLVLFSKMVFRKCILQKNRFSSKYGNLMKQNKNLIRTKRTIRTDPSELNSVTSPVFCLNCNDTIRMSLSNYC